MADTIKPRPPVATAEVNYRVVLRWAGASDNVSVDHYKVFDGPTFLKKVMGRICTTPPLTPGLHELRVVAYDAAGNYANSNIVRVNVPGPVKSSAPSASFMSPLDKAVIKPTAEVGLDAVAPEGLSKIVWSVDNVVVSTSNFASVSGMKMANLPDGPHVLKAVVHDIKGQMAIATRSVTVRR